MTDKAAPGVQPPKDTSGPVLVAQRGVQTAVRAWFRDLQHPQTREALTRRCPICFETPRRVCVDPFGAGGPLPDRVVHLARWRPDLKPKRSKQ